jgi:hypothetical protein
MRRAALLAVVLGACGTTAVTGVVEDARARDEAVVAARADEFDAPPLAERYIVVQDGDVAATARFADDAIGAAWAKSPTTPHRFVFRPADRGTPLYRMAYVADGGVVAGRRFLEALGLEAVGAPGQPPVVRAKGARTGVGLGTPPRLAVEIATLDGAARRTIDAVYDPDFDGGLLVPVAVAAELALERYEVPGDAEVQVALGRPFLAHRATALAECATLSASGTVEVVYERTSPRK